MVEATAYARLEQIFREASILGDTLALLDWDMSVMMPEGGASARTDQLAVLKTLAHRAITAPHVPDLLAQADAEAHDSWSRANLREMRRAWVHAAAVPADLVEALAKAESACEMAWRQARPAADFAQVAPALKSLLALVREAGQAKAAALGVGVYDALLDQYEPDGRAADIDVVFADLAAFLPGLLGRALDAQGRRPAPRLPTGPFPVAAQRRLGHEVMAAMGFDFAHGRLDTSLHPFCGGYPGDVRITTRYDETDFSPALYGVIHETGHALYEAGLPNGRWRHQPVARARGMQMHESQSLLMEMQACRSRAFTGWLAPRLAAAFGGHGADWEPEALYRWSTRVKADFIRVEADEVTYPAHVIVRYGLEKAMVEGGLAVDDLPAAWNDGYARLLGITPPDDRLGCLQDIHWYAGHWGYFPTYTLGALTAAQLFDAATRADPGILAGLACGDFTPLRGWLGTHVHGLGSSLSTCELLTRATGRPLDAAVFKAHLERRYVADNAP